MAEKGDVQGVLASMPLHEHSSTRENPFSRSRRVLYTVLASLMLIAFIISYSNEDCSDSPALKATRPVVALEKRATTTSTSAAATSSITVDFQVYPPVLTPNSAGQLLFTNGSEKTGVSTQLNAKSSCLKTKTLITHVYANSYGTPFVGPYNPPKCLFNRVTFNLTVTSAGRQFDRLGIMFLGSTEIWRTTTAEPTKAGISWTYIKDMSHYLSLLQTKQKLIFELDNVMDSTYTGTFNVTLQATFFVSENTIDPADQIIPVSARLGPQGKSSVWQYPASNATNTLSLPRNIRKAVFTIAATGQIDEEFWYTNVFQQDVDTFGVGFLYGFSPFREVQLFIDGELTGVVWPFPVIFTGGIVPGLWRPIVGIDAFDLREDEIDITPFLPLLCDGKKHTFTIKVAGITADGKVTAGVEYFWYLSGKIFLWLDPAGSITTGTIEQYSADAPKITLSSSVGTDINGTNETLTYNTAVTRTFSVKSSVTTANGTSVATWHQKLSYTNYGYYYGYGNYETLTQTITGTDKSSSGYARKINYPITVNTNFDQTDAYLSIYANLTRGQTIQIDGTPVFPSGLQQFDLVDSDGPARQASTLTTTQNGTAYYYATATNGSSSGTTSQEMTFSGDSVNADVGAFEYPVVKGSTEYYHRYVEAVNVTVVADQETLIGGPTVDFAGVAVGGEDGGDGFVAASVKKVLGKGPGSSSEGDL